MDQCMSDELSSPGMKDQEVFPERPIRSAGMESPSPELLVRFQSWLSHLCYCRSVADHDVDVIEVRMMTVTYTCTHVAAGVGEISGRGMRS
jgi:hypothetical protein